MRVALLQPASPAGDSEVAFSRIEATLRSAAAAGAEMAVFPELYLPGYNCRDIVALAQRADGEWMERLSRLARESGCGLTVGYAERNGDECHNSAVVLGADGACLARYRKIQLFGPREAELFRSGVAYTVFDLNGIKSALLICYDIEFSGHVAALARKGVRLILVPTANMDPFDHVCRLTVPSQAVNHAVTVVCANYCGHEGDLDYCGASLIAGPDGAIIAQAGRGETLLIADIGAPIDPARLSTQAADWRPVE